MSDGKRSNFKVESHHFNENRLREDLDIKKS